MVSSHIPIIRHISVGFNFSSLVNTVGIYFLTVRLHCRRNRIWIQNLLTLSDALKFWFLRWWCTHLILIILCFFTVINKCFNYLCLKKWSKYLEDNLIIEDEEIIKKLLLTFILGWFIFMSSSLTALRHAMHPLSSSNWKKCQF